MQDLILSILASFVTIFVVMDPFPSIIAFLTHTKKATDSERQTCATKAVIIAGLLAVLFLFAGPPLLDYLRITIADFKVAGGIVLLLLGIETVLGISLGKHEKEGISDVAVLIATPLLTGPGLVSTLILLAKDNGLPSTIIALMFALFFSWVILSNSIRLRKIAGDQPIHIIAKIIGLLLLALGVSYIKVGLAG